MDNVIYIVLAAAVFIAMAGILLFIGSDALEDVGGEYDDFLGLSSDPSDAKDEVSYNKNRNTDSEINLINTNQNEGNNLWIT